MEYVMVLTLTKYIDAEPVDIAHKLEAAIDRGVEAAATRIGAEHSATTTEGIDGGVRMHSGLSALDGSELRVGGISRLTTLTINVPWEATDSTKLLAAGAFAESIATEVQLAA